MDATLSDFFICVQALGGRRASILAQEDTSVTLILLPTALRESYNPENTNYMEDKLWRQ